MRVVLRRDRAARAPGRAPYHFRNRKISGTRNHERGSRDMNDPLGDRMKAIERTGADPQLDPARPAYARIDGRGFSRFTRGLRKPFDARMSAAIERTAAHLLEESQARAAYVQSDETSLLWALSGPGSELFFGGKPQKMASVVAGMATAALTRELLHAALDETGEMAGYAARLPHFDARVAGMADAAEAAEMIAWRGADARRNAISGLARTVFPHRAVQGKSSRDLLGTLDERGIRLDAEDPGAVNGVLLRFVPELRGLTEEERARIPEPHRPAPDALFEPRALHRFCAVSPNRIANLAGVLFPDEEPVLVSGRAEPASCSERGSVVDFQV
ncbi:hypothetical protein DR046_22590 [Jannaschia formosa]|nr:hypothetical protein DR046_22590 [Jannaschia formosa]